MDPTACLPGREIQNAQSSALRAAPAAIAVCRCSRSRPFAMGPAMASIAASHALDRLAVARIGTHSPRPAMTTVVEFGDHDHGLGLGAAADRERAGDRPAFDADGEGGGRRAHRRVRRIAWAPATALQAPGVEQELQQCRALACGRFPRPSWSLFASARILHAAAQAQTAGADNSAIYLYKGADREQRLIAKAREEAR
jgi:hypothetical protein